MTKPIPEPVDPSRVTELALAVLQADRAIAHDAGDDADDDGRDGRDVTGGRGDRRQAGDRAGEQAQERRSLLEAPGHDQPGDRRERGGDVGVQERDGGRRIDLELTAGVEAVPAKP